MFEHPIRDPQPIDMFPITLKQMEARITDTCKPELLLVLSKLETGWILSLKTNEEHFALAQTDGVVTRIFRATKPMNDALDTLGFDVISVPVTSERLEMHMAFLEERSTWLQKQLKKKNLTNQKIGSKLNVHNGYVSMVINGAMKNRIIEDEICQVLGYQHEELFPEIPDQIL